jgi:hypothetical protein
MTNYRICKACLPYISDFSDFNVGDTITIIDESECSSMIDESECSSNDTGDEAEWKKLGLEPDELIELPGV